MLLLLLFSVFV